MIHLPRKNILPQARRGHIALLSYSAVGRNQPGGFLHRPGPPPLSAEDQKEFEELVKAAQRPLAAADGKHSIQSSSLNRDSLATEQDTLLHSDARPKPPPLFEGDVNPVTGEQGGPKQEPLAWGGDGEWTFGGRATDF